MNDEMEQEPPLEPARFNLDRTYYIGLNAIKFDELKGIISTDLPSCFPINSTRGNAYIFLIYIFGSNRFFSVPIKNKTKKSLIQGYKYF